MSLLSEYEQRTAWKYEPIHGCFHTPEGLKNKVADDGHFLDFRGNTVVFRANGECAKIIRLMQEVLYYRLKDTQMLADELPESTVHMTLHDLISPEHRQSDTEAGYRNELEHAQLCAQDITENIRKDYPGCKITMVADRIVNMVSKSLVLLLKPKTEQDYEILQDLYCRYDEITGFPFPYTPHITLAYFRPGMLDGEKLQEAIDHAQICPETAPEFKFSSKGITVQTFRNMMQYNDVPERICFCCDGGMNRSVLAANILNDLARDHGIQLKCEARSAFANMQSSVIPQQVWETLKRNGICPDHPDLEVRYLNEDQTAHFSEFVGLTQSAVQHFYLLRIPEEKCMASIYFEGVKDPQYGEVSYQETFETLYKRSEDFLKAILRCKDR